MGDLVVQQFISSDGFASSDDGEFDLFATVDGGSADFDRSNSAWLDRVSAILLGRRTYQEFVTYWPTDAASHELVAPQINSLPIHVFSTTLAQAPWGDFAEATVQSGDAVQTVRRLKREMRGDLIVWGSLTLTEVFFAAGEVDVLRLVVLPVAIGSGRSVLPGTLGPVRMSLRSTATFDGGLVELEYVIHQ